MPTPPGASIVQRLESLKGCFVQETARDAEALLDAAGSTQFAGDDLIGRLQEVLPLLRAYPASRTVLRRADQLLNGSAQPIDDPDSRHHSLQKRVAW